MFDTDRKFHNTVLGCRSLSSVEGTLTFGSDGDDRKATKNSDFLREGFIFPLNRSSSKGKSKGGIDILVLIL